MHAFHDAAAQTRSVELQSTCERPTALPLGLLPGEVDR
jgi:hypothetical protein